MYPLAISVLGSGGWAAPSPGRDTPGKDLLPVTQQTAWAFFLLQKITKHLTPTGIPFPGCPSRNETLYRLSYRGHRNYITSNVFSVETSTERAMYSKVTISDWRISACTGTRLNKLIIYITKKYVYIYDLRACSLCFVSSADWRKASAHLFLTCVCVCVILCSQSRHYAG
jgi:hypothetical protein